ncbi:hypothetical protein GDO81_010385 [Engystomops pustulosus]|uniref:Uncharacterized protein n=1 Tax=Engystomops pustulosus TaxID=76066 RepID=A0AAV7BZK2_ENGPU|nr:hypothetical protein GDO81_010385 [Engystomops pustulosus]
MPRTCLPVYRYAQHMPPLYRLAHQLLPVYRVAQHIHPSFRMPTLGSCVAAPQRLLGRGVAGHEATRRGYSRRQEPLFSTYHFIFSAKLLVAVRPCPSTRRSVHAQYGAMAAQPKAWVLHR